MTQREDNKPQDRKTEGKPEQRVYEMKGIPIQAYLVETGEFRWIPAFNACGDRENAKRILEVLRKMPEDRKQIWGQRLDVEQAKITCPVIKKETDLCKEFDELCAAYTKKPATNPEEKHKGGEEEK